MQTLRVLRVLLSSLACAVLGGAAGAVQFDWNQLPAWTASAFHYEGSPYPFLNLGVDEYPASSFRALGGFSLMQSLGSYWTPFAKTTLCKQVSGTISKMVSQGGQSVHIDECTPNPDIQTVYVDSSDLAGDSILMHGGSTFNVRPFTQGAQIGVLIPNNRIVFTVTSIVTQPTIRLNADVFVSMRLRQGAALNGEPKLVLADFDATLSRGSLASDNVLQITAQFNTTLQNTAYTIRDMSFAGQLGGVQGDIQKAIDGGLAAAKDYPDLAHIAWSDSLNSIYLLFSGAKADVPLSGPGVIQGSLWWDAALHKNVASCAGLSVNTTVQAGAPGGLFGTFPKVAVGTLAPMTLAQSGPDTYCTFTVSGLPVNGNLYVEAAVTPNAFKESAISATIFRGPIVIPGGRCQVMRLPGKVPGYKSDTPTICGAGASQVNFNLLNAPPPPN